MRNADMVRECAIRRAFKSGNMTMALLEMHAYKPSYSIESLMVWVVVISATNPYGRKPLSELARSLPVMANGRVRALDTIARIARAIETENWYDARAMASTIRHHAPDINRSHIAITVRRLLQNRRNELSPQQVDGLFRNLQHLIGQQNES